MRERIIDLDEEFLNLFKKEEMFAFFDFSLGLPEDRTIPGLCKISRPKSAGANSYYISMLLMIDVDDDTMCRLVDEYMNKINWKDLNVSMPEIVSVLPMPRLSTRAGIYFREVYIYLTADKLTKSFFAQFHPLFAGVTGFRAATPIFWDDMPQDAKPVGMSAPPADKGVAWCVNRLKDFFG